MKDKSVPSASVTTTSAMTLGLSPISVRVPEIAACASCPSAGLVRTRFPNFRWSAGKTVVQFAVACRTHRKAAGRDDEISRQGGHGVIVRNLFCAVRNDDVGEEVATLSHVRLRAGRVRGKLVPGKERGIGREFPPIAGERRSVVYFHRRFRDDADLPRLDDESAELADKLVVVRDVLSVFVRDARRKRILSLARVRAAPSPPRRAYALSARFPL